MSLHVDKSFDFLVDLGKCWVQYQHFLLGLLVSWFLAQNIWSFGEFLYVDWWNVRIGVLRVQHESVSIGTILIIGSLFLSSDHFVKFNVRQFVFWQLRLEYQDITLIWLIGLLFFLSRQHLTKIHCSDYSTFWFFRLQNQIITIHLSLLLHNWIDVSLLHLFHIWHSHICINLLILRCVLPHLCHLSLPLLILLELLQFLSMLPILLIRHPSSYQNILSQFRPNCIQITIIKLPMFREQIFVWQVGWPNITLWFHQWHSNILVNLSVCWVVYSIIHIFLLV